MLKSDNCFQRFHYFEQARRFGIRAGELVSLIGGLTAAAGGGDAIPDATAQYQYNDLYHADNDALNAAKAACRTSRTRIQMVDAVPVAAGRV
jgi:hypothetical protein